MTNVTQLPAPVDVAATWDTSAEQLYGQVIGTEQAAKGTTSTSGRPSTSSATRAGGGPSSRSARIRT